MRSRTVGFAVAGMAAGYVAWLIGGAIIILIAPVSLWAYATAVMVAGIAVVSFVAARRHQGRQDVAIALRWAPLLPILASLYLLLSIVN